MAEPAPPDVHVSAAQFAELFRAVSAWERWGSNDQRGALNYLEPSRVVEAARLVQEGTTVTLSLPMNTKAAADNPEPAVHYMGASGRLAALQVLRSLRAGKAA